MLAMNFRRASWLVLGVAFASSSTGFAQQRLPYDPCVQPTLPGGARPPAGGFALTPPVVAYRAGSSATTATEATFATTLSGTAFEWSFGGGAIPNTATSTNAGQPDGGARAPRNVYSDASSLAVQRACARALTPSW